MIMDEFELLSGLFEGPDGDLFKGKENRNVPTAVDRLIDSFSEITEFVMKNNRLPLKVSENIKEAGLGARLESIRIDKDKRENLIKFDTLGLLDIGKAPESLEKLFESDENLFKDEGLFDMSQVPMTRREVLNTGDVAIRKSSKDFIEKYRFLFIDQQKLLADGKYKLSPFITIDQLQPKSFYVYDGMMCYVTHFGRKERKIGGYSQQRIKVVFENGTESNMYKRSLAQRLYEGGSVVIDKNLIIENNDKATGYIYIIKSLSDDPSIVTVKDLYKIGVTTNNVENRIKNAKIDPTYLMAQVKIVANYKLIGEYQPIKVESLIHRFFSNAKVNLEIIDKLGKTYIPDEWYSVPIEAIEEMIDRISDGSIVKYYYDNNVQQIKEI
jgi:hypothetical protein